MRPAGKSHRYRRRRGSVYDVVGAGDTVTTYLAATKAAGASAREAAVIANTRLGWRLGKLGPATVSLEEVLAA